MCVEKTAPGPWSDTQRVKNQYIPEGKLFFVLFFSQTTAATFQHIASLTKQITSEWQQGFLGNGVGEWVVTLGSLLIIGPPGLLLIRSYEIFIAQDRGNGCSHPAFQKERKSPENICRSQALTRMLHLPHKNVFCHRTGAAIRIAPGDTGRIKNNDGIWGQRRFVRWLSQFLFQNTGF